MILPPLKSLPQYKSLVQQQQQGPQGVPQALIPDVLKRRQVQFPMQQSFGRFGALAQQMAGTPNMQIPQQPGQQQALQMSNPSDILRMLGGYGY